MIFCQLNELSNIDSPSINTFLLLRIQTLIVQNNLELSSLYEKYIDKYLKALEKEKKKRYSNEIINTIYIGGGTPSSLTLKELEKLFSIIKIFKLNKEIEFTFECNIENTTKEKLSFLYKNGVNRLSFGVQSFNPKILKILNRKHNKEQINKVIKLAKEVGFQNINADLIYGLKDQTIKDLKKDLDEFLNLDINHISTYSLIIEDHTILKNNSYENIDEDTEYNMYKLINKTLSHNNFKQYEISNYAKNNTYSSHNLTYWNNDEYYGFGLGATSYLNNYRIQNTKNINNYINGNYQKSKSYENKKIRMSNELILGLRKIEGIDLCLFKQKYKISLDKVYNINNLLENKKILIKDNHLKINPDYLYISNDILVQFILD